MQDKLTRSIALVAVGFSGACLAISLTVHGPQGVRGPQGPQGTQGQQGDPGAQGPAGPPAPTLPDQCQMQFPSGTGYWYCSPDPLGTTVNGR